VEAIHGGGHGCTTSPFPRRRSRVRAEVGERGERGGERMRWQLIGGAGRSAARAWVCADRQLLLRVGGPKAGVGRNQGCGPQQGKKVFLKIFLL
jgi:hypothetical protein